MSGLLIDLSVKMIYTLLGALLSKAMSLIRVVIPARTLWQIVNPDELVIVVAHSVDTDTGAYLRSATGIGQVRALAFALASLNKAYRSLSFRNIYLSTDPLQERLENDLLLLGGPKTNEITARFLGLISDCQPVTQDGSSIFWRKKLVDSWRGGGAEEFYGEVEDKKVITDYGVIIRVQSPFTTSRKRTVVLLSGSHTYGTVAAAKYFVENLGKDFSIRTLKKHNIVVLISAEILDNYPVSVKLEKSYMWRKT